MDKPTDRFQLLCQTFAGVAGIASLASAIIVFIALINMHNITDLGMFAIAMMAAAPAAMGVGIALFLYLAFTVDSRKPRDVFDHGAAGEFIRRIDRPNEP